MAADTQAMQDELAALKELRDLKQRKAEIEGAQNRGAGQSFTDLAQSFNKGLVDTINLPSELLNIPLGAVGAPQIPTEAFRQKVADTGLTAQPGQEATGFFPRAAEILGASVLPEAGILSKGAQVLKSGLPSASRSALQQLAAVTAKSPVKSAAVTTASSLGAGLGGEATRKFTDNPTLITLGELAGGFTTPMTTAVLRIGGKPLETGLKKALLPFTKAGAAPRAAARLQGLSANPEADAAAISTASKVSPARQTGNPRLISLEKAVLERNPELEAQLNANMNDAINGARQQASAFGGENRVREILQRGQDYLNNLLSLRVAKASANAQNKIASIGTDISQRDISKIARSELDKALIDARTQENQLWSSIDQDTPASFANARKSLGAMRDEASDLVPFKVPNWLSRAINTNKAVTFKDVQQVRSKALSEARKASNSGKFDKARILNTIANGDQKKLTGILDDMSATNDPNAKAALAFSRKLNQTFNEGAVKDILSKGADKGAGVAAEDTLNKVFSGSTPATNVKRFLQASPESAPQIEQYLKSGFLKRASQGGKFNQAQAQAQIDKLDSQGMFELFPNMKDEFNSIREAFNAADSLSGRAATVGARGGSRLVHDSNKSLAGIILKADPGEEINAVLKSENPVQVASALRRRMGSDVRAENGLKSFFVDTLFNNASKTGTSGEIEISGKALAQSFNENLDVAKALGMDSADITRTRNIIRNIVKAQTTGVKVEGSILDDKPSRILSLVARIFGAQRAEKLISKSAGMGSGLIAAREGSALAQEMLQKFTTSEAQKLLIAAHTDPVLYKALLTRVDAPKSDVLEATRFIESWLIGAGIEAQADKGKQ